MNTHPATPNPTTTQPCTVIHAELHIDGRTLRLPLERDPAETATPNPGFIERAFRHHTASGHHDDSTVL